MSNYSFKHGTKFMIDDTEYIVRKELEKIIEVENLSYKKVETWHLWDLLKLWEEEKLVFKVVKGNEFEVELIDYELIPKVYREEAEKRLGLLKPVLKGEVLSSEIKNYVASLPEDKRISVATFYNWKKKYERTNDIRSLISRHDLKGPKKRWSNKIAQSKVVGVIDDFLYDGEHFTLDFLYNEYLLRMDELNEFREEPIKPVSESTFWRIKNEVKDLEKIEGIKYGKVLARLNKNGAQSKVIVHRPLERVEIDWTPVDILLVDPRTLKPKKPWLVYAVDKYSDHPLGFYVTFDAIDAKAVKQCLLHCLMPKTYIKDLYPLVENEWSAFGKPELLVLDNSKVNDSLDVLDACQQLGIETMFCPVDSGYLKASIERHFGILNTKVFHSLKGTTFSSIFQRGRYDSEGKAYLTMQSFIYICHIAIVDMIANDNNVSRRATRSELWVKGLQENPEINLTISRTKNELKMILMSGIEYRSISNKGVVIKNEHYTSPELMKLRYRLQTDCKEKKKVRVRFDFTDIRKIYVYNEYEKRYIEAYNKNLQEKGFQTELPVPYSDLEWDSKLIAKAKNSRDRRLFARANRKLRLIQDTDRKKYIKYKNSNDQGQIEESNESPSSYHGISTEGISHIQLGTAEAADTIQLIKEETDDITSKKHKKKSKSGKQNKNKKTSAGTQEPNYISSTFDIDIDDLPNWETKYRGV